MTELPALRSPWNRLFPNSLFLVATLLVLVFSLHTQAYFGEDLYATGPIMLAALVMCFAPFVFFDTTSRRAMGFLAPYRWLYLLLPLSSGAVLGYLAYRLGLLLYGTSDAHWFTSVSYTYLTDPRFAAIPRDAAFAVFTIPAAIAIPVAQEFLFRGIVQNTVASRFSPSIGVFAAAASFATLHAAFHAFQSTYLGINYFLVPGLIWFAICLGLGYLYSYFAKRSDSLWSPIFAHAGFNLAMNVTIFYGLLTQPIG